MVRVAAAALAFAASLMAVSASANAPGHVATQNLNQRQEAESTPSDGMNSDETKIFDGLVDELAKLLGDAATIVEKVKSKPDQA